MLNLSKDESRLYNFVLEIINEVMDNYGYDYEIGNNQSNRYYTCNIESIKVYNKNKSILEKAELISLGYYLFKRIGLDDIEVSISKNKDICNLLDILEVEYLSNIDNTNLTWNYVINDNILGHGNDNEFNIDINSLLKVLMEYINKDALKRKLDVNILATSEEEKYQALKIAQGIRLNNINVLINSDSASKFAILLNEDDLNKGIITLKDNTLNEEIKLNDSEVIDYLLGNI